MKTARKSALGARGLAPAAARRSGRQTDSGAEGGQRIEQAIDRLATQIRQFQIDTQRFFAGDLPAPPDELGDRIQAELRRLRNANLKGAAVNFRLGGLEAQFNSRRELFGRRLREREQGLARTKAAAESPAPDPVRGVVVGREADPAAAKALYQGLYAAAGDRKPKLDFAHFRAYLDRQSEMIRKKTGCAEIQFRVAVEDGKMKLKAKPIR